MNRRAPPYICLLGARGHRPRAQRLAGARMVTELFTAAKGGRNKVLQLLDYLNDRHEICHMRGGSAREERAILHNIRSAIELLRCHKLCVHQCTHTRRAARRMQVGDVDLDAHIYLGGLYKQKDSGFGVFSS